MQKAWTKTQEFIQPIHFIDFASASPEALDQILTALNAEVDQALAEKRFPTLDGAFGRLVPSTQKLQ